MKTTSLFCTIVLMLLMAGGKTAAADKHLPMIDELFSDFNKPNAPGASVMVISQGKVLLAKSYGLANLEDKVSCAPEANYRLASVSKQFTAMTIMMLADKGKLSLDDHITKFFPEFPEYGKDITVRQLLHHTSGLIDYEDIIPQGTTIPLVDINVLRLLQEQNHTYFPPGTKFRYCNTAFAMLALITEKVSGMTYSAFLRENIFAPLHMDHTLAYEPGISKVSNRVFGYSKKEGDFHRADQSVTSSVLGDGGIYSSVNDLFHWDQALYSTKLVSKKMLEEAFTAGENTMHEHHEYGFGWFISEYRGLRNIWHSGNTIGFSTRIERFPDKQFTVIILTNQNNAHLAEIPHKIADMYLFDAK